MSIASNFFNSDQLDHMRHLDSFPPERRCWCGWGLLGRCDTHDPCPPGCSLADRLRTAQPCCGRPAPRPDARTTSGSHYAGCTPRHREPFAIDLGLIDLGGEAGGA